jgi:hypothetical protein
MIATPEVREEILRAYKQNPQRFSPFKASKAIGVPMSIVLEVVEANKERLTQSSEVHGGMGRPELQIFMVARKRGMGSQWDNTSPAILSARQTYMDGTSEMCTGRDGPWHILYSIPRNRPAKPRPNYFTPEPS